MRKGLVLLLASLTLQAFAGTAMVFPVVTCPAVGDEYGKMLAKLEAIKTSIKKDANCDNVSVKIKDLADLVSTDRTAVLQIAQNTGQQSLTAAQGKTVRDYAESVTEAVGGLNDLFAASNYCFRDDHADQQLSALSGFVGEAAQLVGSLSGPWGAPLALAGDAVAGFLTGMDQIFKTRAGYDFKKTDEWNSYVQNLCTYNSYREQVAHLLNPQARLDQLQNLKDKLESQISVIERDCTECRQIADNFEAQKSAGEQALLSAFSTSIQSADQRFAKPYGSYIIQNLGLHDWVVSEIARVKAEMATYWTDASGRYLLTQANANIEQFLVEKEAGPFLAFGVSQSNQDYSDFKNFAMSEGRGIYLDIDGEYPSALNGRIKSVYWTDPLSLFRALIIQPIAWDSFPQSDEMMNLQYAWNHFHDESLNRFTSAQASTRMVLAFCAFFKQAGFYNQTVRGECELPWFNASAGELDQLDADLDKAHVTSGPAAGPVPAAVSDADAGLSRIDLIRRSIERRGIGN